MISAFLPATCQCILDAQWRSVVSSSHEVLIGMPAARSSRRAPGRAAPPRDGIAQGSPEVRFERLLPGPIETVWAYITEPKFLETWLAAAPVAALIGRPQRNLEVLDARGESARFARREHGVVKRCEPPRFLTYSWIETEAGNADGPAIESEVAIELKMHGNQVRLTLIHRRMDPQHCGDHSAKLGQPKNANTRARCDA